MPVIIDEVETTVDTPTAPPSTPAPTDAGGSTPSPMDIAKTLRRIARREARLAAD